MRVRRCYWPIGLAFGFGYSLTLRGVLGAGLDFRAAMSVLFWGSLAASLVVAFVLTTPLNRWMIARGKGHAVVHAYHSH